VQAVTGAQGQGGGGAGGSYRGSWDALRTIVRSEGVGRGLYRGFGITLFSFGPFSALYFSFYESMKDLYLKSTGRVEAGAGAQQLPFTPSLLLSAAAGSAASVLTNPLDLVKLRIQIERRTAAGAGGALGVAGMLGRIWRVEGLSGLFRGAAARILFHAPNTAITMALFETCRGWWQRVLE
jgi:hypothetical protein